MTSKRAPAQCTFNLDTTQIAEHPTTIASHGIELLNATFMRKNGVEVEVDWWLAGTGYFDLDSEKLSFDITPKPLNNPPQDYVRFDPHGGTGQTFCWNTNFHMDRSGDHLTRCSGQLHLRIPARPA